MHLMDLLNSSTGPAPTRWAALFLGAGSYVTKGIRQDQHILKGRKILCENQRLEAVIIARLRRRPLHSRESIQKSRHSIILRGFHD